MRALNSAVTGLQAQQTAMDVIGNNIANVNTDGYKATTTDFEDLFYQTIQGASSTTDPTQVGYGAKVSGISKDMSAAGETTTNSSDDLYIDGGGYFVINTNKNDPTALQYTRVGEFHFTSDGSLVDANGNYVMGLDSANSPVRIDLSDAKFTATDGTSYTLGTTVLNGETLTFGSSEISNITFNTDGTISAEIGGKEGTFQYGASSGTTAAGSDVKIALASFTDEGGLTQVGNTSFASSAASGAATYFQANTNGNSTTLISGALEQSNVDLAKEFTNMIVTQRGFQANSRVITVSDTLLEEIVNLKRS